MSEGITLVLGGLGIKGVSSIGILQSIRDHNIKVKRIVATGIGSIAGAQYALGNNLSALTDYLVNFFTENHKNLWGLEYFGGVLQTRRKGVLESFNYFLRERLYCQANLTRISILPWDIIDNFFQELFGNHTFEELGIPLTISTIDLVAGNEYLIKSGLLAEKLKAGIAFPGLFSPVDICNHKLVSSTLFCELPLDSLQDEDQPIVAFDIPIIDTKRVPESLIELIAITDDIRANEIKKHLLCKASHVFTLQSLRRFRWGNYKQIPHLIDYARQNTDTLLEKSDLI